LAANATRQAIVLVVDADFTNVLEMLGRIFGHRNRALGPESTSAICATPGRPRDSRSAHVRQTDDVVEWQMRDEMRRDRAERISLKQANVEPRPKVEINRSGIRLHPGRRAEAA